MRGEESERASSFDGVRWRRGRTGRDVKGLSLLCLRQEARIHRSGVRHRVMTPVRRQTTESFQKASGEFKGVQRVSNILRYVGRGLLCWAGSARLSGTVAGTVWSANGARTRKGLAAERDVV